MSNEQRNNFINAFNKYSPSLYRYCYYRVYSPNIAEECVQETFTHAWIYLKGGNSIRNIKSFLYRVSRNWIIDNHRKQITFGHREESLDETLLKVGDQIKLSYNGQEHIERQVLVEEVRALIQRLPPTYRELLMMRYFDDLAPRDIAKKLHVHPNIISTKLNRGIKKLKMLINSKA